MLKADLCKFWSQPRPYWSKAVKYTETGVKKLISKIPAKYDIPPPPQPQVSTTTQDQPNPKTTKRPAKDRFMVDHTAAEPNDNAQILKLAGTVHNNQLADGLSAFITSTFDLTIHDVSIQNI